MSKNYKLEVFEILAWDKADLIAKVMYDNGVKTEEQCISWFKTTPLSLIPYNLKVAVLNSFRDVEAGFTDVNEIPNIFTEI